MKYQIIVIVVALILTALALTSCVEQKIVVEDGRPHLYIDGQRHVRVTDGQGGIDWVAR